MNPKVYLFYTQHETDAANQPITALYLSPRETFDTTGDARPAYDADDRAMIDNVKTCLFLKEVTPWVFESTRVTPPDIIRWLSQPEHWRVFKTTDKYAQLMKDGY